MNTLRIATDRVSTELFLKFQLKFQKENHIFQPCGQKNKLSPSHNMNFDINFHPQHRPEISNKLEFPI